MTEISRESIETKITKLRSLEESSIQRLESIRSDITVLERTLALFTPKRQPREVNLHVSADEVKGKEIEEACMLIAMRNSGELRSTSARRFLVSAGVLSEEYGSTALYEVLSESPRFRRESRGVYRLRPRRRSLGAPDETTDELPPEQMEKLRTLRSRTGLSALPGGGLVVTRPAMG